MKKRGMKKRVLAALMTACMVVGSVPGVSLADATTDNSGISYTLDGVKTTDSAKTAITLNKEAKPAGDGKYDITLTVDATKAKDQIQVNPTEVAFVLDASGSMAWCTDETHNHGRSVSGYNCGKVVISHCRNAEFAESVKSAIQSVWDKAEVKIVHARGLCSYYAEKGGLIIGF